MLVISIVPLYYPLSSCLMLCQSVSHPRPIKVLLCLCVTRSHCIVCKLNPKTYYTGVRSGISSMAAPEDDVLVDLQVNPSADRATGGGD